MKTRSSYRSILEVPSGVIQRDDFSRLFLTRGIRYSDGKMDSLGIDRIVSGGITLPYDKGLWALEIGRFASELLAPVVQAGYNEEDLLVESLRKNYKLSVSIVMFRGIVEKKLFLLSEYEAAGVGGKMFMHNGMVSMMN